MLHFLCTSYSCSSEPRRGSVGGGIKVTTFGIVVAMAVARFHTPEKGNSFFYRTIPEEVVDRAVSILFVSAQIVVVFTFALMINRSWRAGVGPLHRDMFFESYVRGCLRLRHRGLIRRNNLRTFRKQAKR